MSSAQTLSNFPNVVLSGTYTPSITLYRSDIVTEANRIENEIIACADVESLIVILNSQNWPKE